MRIFDIYLMEEEITRLYLGREGLLFQLFLETKNESDPQKRVILENQIAYITKPLDETMLHHSLTLEKISKTSKGKWAIIKRNESRAILTLEKNYLSLSSTGDYGAETTFFEILRHAFPYFFAIDYQNECGAWLSPHKKHILYQRKLVL